MASQSQTGKEEKLHAFPQLFVSFDSVRRQRRDCINCKGGSLVNSETLSGKGLFPVIGVSHTRCGGWHEASSSSCGDLGDRHHSGVGQAAREERGRPLNMPVGWFVGVPTGGS